MEKIDYIVTFISVVALAISIISAYLAGQANAINVNIFKRQGVIDLFMAWQGVNEIDKDSIVGPDVIKAGNALSLTASLWNHDVLEKSILYQTYWDSYRTLYDQLFFLDEIIPGKKRTCKSLLTSEIVKVYDEMKKYDSSKVDSSKIR